MLDRGELGTGCDATHKVGTDVVLAGGIPQLSETHRGERGTVREGLGTIEFGKHGASDDPVVVASFGAFAVHGVADLLAQLVEGRGSEGDLVRTGGGAAGDDLGPDRAPHRRECPTP